MELYSYCVNGLITEFISIYRAIVNKFYIDYYFEIIKFAEEKFREINESYEAIQKAKP